MFRVLPSGRLSWVRTLLVAAALVGLVASVFPPAFGSPVRSIAPLGHAASLTLPGPGSGVAAPPARTAHLTSTPHPALTTTGTFFENNSNVATQTFDAQGCATYNYGTIYNYCYPQAVSPTLLTLANGNIGLSFSLWTNQSGTGCTLYASSVNERVGFSLSTDNGQTFGGITYLGNETCSYLNAIEPSFAVASDGTVYGAYVEYNSTGYNQGQYTYRTSDSALGFTKSTDNGVTFSDPTTIAVTSIANPQVATFGQSVYVLFENISNGTSYISRGMYGYSSLPMSENLLYSPDGGATWSGPYILPGQNASTYYTESGGSIAVNATGTVGVSYFTNHTCVNLLYGYYCYDYGDDLVVATSTTNGSAWNGPFTVARSVGENQYYTGGYYLSGYFQALPQSQLVFDPTGQSIYIAYSGNYNKTDLAGLAYYPYSNYQNAGVFAAVGSVLGTGWTVSQVQVPLSTSSYDNLYDASIGISGGTVYVTYTWENATYCYGTNCPLLDESFSQWFQTSTDGISWTHAQLVSVKSTCTYYCGTYNTASSFSGFSSSVGFTAGGTALLGYDLPGIGTSTFALVNGTYVYNYSYPTSIEVAQPWFGPTVSINFTEQYLPTGSPWSFSLNGVTFSSTDSYIEVTNVPVNKSLIVSAPSIPISYGVEGTPTASVPSSTAFVANGTVFFNFTLSYLLKLSIEPTTTYDSQISFTDPNTGSYYSIYQYDYCPTCTPGRSSYPLGDWYFPNGTQLQLIGYGYPIAFSYWTGTGAQAYTGTGDWANLTINGPVNETGWVGGFGFYNATVNPIGLPSTSVYNFDFDGTPYSAQGNQPVELSNVGTGAHEVTDVWANSSQAGWMYFGGPTPSNPVIVPAEPVVNLTFAYVDVGTPAGTVTFQAQGLTTGTVWNFGFNGTTYSSSTPTLSVSTHSGTFPVAAFPVVSQNGSVGYAPSGVGATWSVTTGQTYTVNFVQAYKVAVTGGTGGSVSGAGTGTLWLAAGATTQFVASAHASYAFGGWTGSGLGSYTGASSIANVTVNGPIVQTASFYPVPASRFNLSFTETGLASGTWWTVFLGGTGYSSDQSSFVVHNLLACSAPGGNYNLTVPYAYSSDALTRYIVTTHLSRTICTTGSTVVNVGFASQFQLTLQATAGGFPEATIGFNTITTHAWVALNQAVTLDALSQPGY
ncbi:MAG TPA: sialidase family protein, partial [Thermoplasmata archaeon]